MDTNINEITSSMETSANPEEKSVNPVFSAAEFLNPLATKTYLSKKIKKIVIIAGAWAIAIVISIVTIFSLRGFPGGIYYDAAWFDELLSENNQTIPHIALKSDGFFANSGTYTFYTRDGDTLREGIYTYNKGEITITIDDKNTVYFDSGNALVDKDEVEELRENPNRNYFKKKGKFIEGVYSSSVDIAASVVTGDEYFTRFFNDGTYYKVTDGYVSEEGIYFIYDNYIFIKSQTESSFYPTAYIYEDVLIDTLLCVLP